MNARDRYEAMAAQLDAEVFPALPDAPEGLSGALASGVQLTRGDGITPEPIRWLWPGWLALGKLHIMAGAPGAGKTTAALSMAATVTAGGRWPDGALCPAGDVLIWSGEDDPADTLIPRLMATGADRSRIWLIGDVLEADGKRPFDPATDLPGLLAAAERLPELRFILVDPVVSAVSGDSHKNTEVRRSLQPLVDMARQLRAAVLGISHFSKGGAGGDPASRVVGSIAFTAVARVVLVCAKTRDADGTERRIMARSKSNIGPDDGGFAYGLEDVEAAPGILASRTAWGEALEGSARELLKDAESDEVARAASDDVVEMLRAELVADCWTNSQQASKPLLDAGFTKKQIWTASKKLGIVRKKGGMDGGWYWRLPAAAAEDSSLEDSTEDSEGSNFRDGESSESSEGLESSADDQPTT